MLKYKRHNARVYLIGGLGVNEVEKTTSLPICYEDKDALLPSELPSSTLYPPL